MSANLTSNVNAREEKPFCQIKVGEGPLVAAAIHDGHEVRSELIKLFALDEAGRLREEDPFTGQLTSVALTCIIGNYSRFEVDLNRPREKAVYLRPEDAWGLQVWKAPLAEDVINNSLAQYDEFYNDMRRVFNDLEASYGHFVVFDIHSYNHLRDGKPADPVQNPEVNIGTGTMNRARWASLIDRFMADLRAFDFMGRHLDVCENVKFQGGQFSRWIHENYPNSGCSIAIEWKKFFMDEWSGEPNSATLEVMRAALESTVTGVLEELAKR